MSDLDDLRESLDAIDDGIVDMLAQRQEAVRQVASLKGRTNAPLRDVLRETRQIARLAERARERGLDEMFIVRVFREIVDFSVRTQEVHLGAPSTAESTRPITVAF